MSGVEQAKLGSQVDSFNKALNDGKVKGNELGKDDFLKILLTQLTNQDPTKPMEDKEFIAQMAQFSSLEQMKNLTSGFSELTGMFNASQAFSLVGKQVQVITANGSVTGTVDEVSGRDNPQVLVNGKYYSYDDVEKVIRG